MEIVGHTISVRRTARYFTLGNSTIRNEAIIFVLHGYGMKASAFINDFANISSEKLLIVAPEGLSRFYKKGFSGDVVASWMTRDDRLNEIEDYIAYLDLLYKKMVPDHARVMVIGFSQGAATASRWLMKGNSHADQLVIWAGDFAPDINTFPAKKPAVTHVMASDDEFITSEQMEQQTLRLRASGFDVQVLKFQGGHAIHQATLSKIVHQFLG